jgi:hypothetical protein
MYNVGQIVWVVSQRKVIPVRIAEQIIRRNVAGESVEYRVCLDMDANKFFDLEEMSALHFETLEDVRDHMMNSATKTIDELLQSALSESQRRFNIVAAEQDEQEKLRAIA